MKLEITPLRINKKEENQITSSSIFKKNQRKLSDNYQYDEKGLFSDRIFGKIHRCECGNQVGAGYCEICGCRVIEPENVPNYFIDLGVYVPKYDVDFGKYSKARPLLEYESFLVVHEDNSYEIIEDTGKEDKSSYFSSDNKVLIGLEAAKFIFPDIDSWAKKNLIDFISVPHPTQRPNLRLTNGQIKLTPINLYLVEILKNLEQIQEYKKVFAFSDKENPSYVDYFLLSLYHEIYSAYMKCMQEIHHLFAANTKNSYIGGDIRGHRVTSAVKGVIINRYDLDEDIVLIGDTFIQTLYPYLYQKFDGNMEAINNYFIENEERVLLNRPPTICHLSIMGMKPRVASCYKYGTFDDGAVGPNSKSDYEEIDTLGIRTIAINPIITDGIAGDFDGDVVLVISLFTEDAKKEADAMLPSVAFVNYANGTIRNVIPEDIMFSNWEE